MRCQPRLVDVSHRCSISAASISAHVSLSNQSFMLSFADSYLHALSAITYLVITCTSLPGRLKRNASYNPFSCCIRSSWWENWEAECSGCFSPEELKQKLRYIYMSIHIYKKYIYIIYKYIRNQVFLEIVHSTDKFITKPNRANKGVQMLWLWFFYLSFCEIVLKCQLNCFVLHLI